MATMRRISIWLAVLSFTLCGNAHAGAWTQEKHHWLIISSTDFSRALDGYDGKGNAKAPIRFIKFSSSELIEYGLTDKLTLFTAPEYVTAQAQWATEPPVRAGTFSVEVGARYRVLDNFGVLSLQASYRNSGPFDLSNSRGLDTASIGELRLLYGTNFRFWGRDGFADIELAERDITHPRPNETILDLTGGIWFGTKTMLMLQSFNVLSGGDADPPDTYFRTHKIELSAVRRLSGPWSVQLGVFVAPAGQNSLVEQGISIGIWKKT